VISEKLGIPSSVVYFIEGQVPKKVNARHYTKLLRQDESRHLKYSAYLEGMRGAATDNPH
jgi:intergrase/recombinase